MIRWIVREVQQPWCRSVQRHAAEQGETEHGMYLETQKSLEGPIHY